MEISSQEKRVLHFSLIQSNFDKGLKCNIHIIFNRGNRKLNEITVIYIFEFWCIQSQSIKCISNEKQTFKSLNTWVNFCILLLIIFGCISYWQGICDYFDWDLAVNKCRHIVSETSACVLFHFVSKPYSEKIQPSYSFHWCARDSTKLVRSVCCVLNMVYKNKPIIKHFYITLLFKQIQA